MVKATLNSIDSEKALGDFPRVVCEQVKFRSWIETPLNHEPLQQDIEIAQRRTHHSWWKVGGTRICKQRRVLPIRRDLRMTPELVNRGPNSACEHILRMAVWR